MHAESITTPCQKVCYNSSCECKKVVTDILGKIEFLVDLQNSSKNTQIKIYFKSEVNIVLFLWPKQDAKRQLITKKLEHKMASPANW